MKDAQRMKSRHSSNRAILVLESPWELDGLDSNRTSVLPFVEGVAKYAGDTEVFHATFYDESSFKKALACLCKRSFLNTTVYVAAHGYKRNIGGVEIIKMLTWIGLESKKYNITGIMLGSCFVGENTTAIEVCLEGSNLKWCVGYASECAWLAGTLIDCSVLMEMLAFDIEDFSDAAAMIQSFSRAISHFSSSFHIGDDYRQKPVSLRDSLKFVIQPSGKGRRAVLVSEEVFKAYADSQLLAKHVA
jgi:hypothetical protein